MDLETLKITLKNSSVSDGDIESTFHKFSEETGRTNIPDFAIYLYKENLIDTKLLSTVLTQSKIEITDLSHVAKGESVNPLDASDQSRNYDVLGAVGQGGMGEILLAKDHNLRRTVAYKKLHPEFAQNKEVLGQFLNEVQITSQLEHPNVVPIYNLEVAPDGSIAYSMKLVQGKTFKDLISKSKAMTQAGETLPSTHSLSVFLEHFLKVCDALDLAHSKGVLHRDLKPANIMIGAYNEVCVMDWGIACLMDEEHESKQAIGTPRYMAPEQAGGLNNLLDARTDLFSLGLILFELVTLTAAVPHETDVIEILKNTIRGKLNPIVHLDPKVRIPDELKAIIEKATSRKRIDRYQSVKEMADDLRRYRKGDAILARPDNAIQSVMRFISQNKEKTLVAILLILLASASLISSSMYYRHISLIKAQKHEAQIHLAITQVSKRGNAIDQHFFYLEGLLRSYGTAILQRYRYGQPSKGQYYTLQDFKNPLTRPANTPFVKKYGTEVNVDWSVLIHPPGSDAQTMQSMSEIMHPLQTLMKQIVVDSFEQKSGVKLKPSEVNPLILARKMPILWIFFALENGYYMGYPSTYNTSNSYDPRKRPWYQAAKKSGKFHWQEPYRTTGGEVDLPCAMPLFDENNQYQGVAVIEMTFDFVQNNFLDLKLAGIQESSLVNQKGDIIISTVDHYSAGRQADKKKTKTKLKPVDNPTVKEALKQKRSGYHIEPGSNGNTLYIYHYISSLEWFYVIKADESQFLKQVGQV